MAALNFPTSPALDQTYTANGFTWKWNGTSWVALPAVDPATITGVVLLENGGTGAATASGARANLEAQATLVSGTNIKSINSTSLLGAGDLSLFTGGLTRVEVVATLPGSPNATTLYIVTG